MLNQEYDDPKLKWEMIKIAVKNYTLKFSARQAKAERNELAALEKKLKYTEENLNNSLFSDSTQDHIIKLQNDIQDVMERKTRRQ